MPSLLGAEVREDRRADRASVEVVVTNAVEDDLDIGDFEETEAAPSPEAASEAELRPREVGRIVDSASTSPVSSSSSSFTEEAEDEAKIDVAKRETEPEVETVEPE